jgi:2-dehydropantoate 2-reductase
MNCAGNAVTAITQTSYAAAGRNLQTRDVMSQVIAETVAVARACGVALPEVDFIGMGLKFIESIGNATSSTAQDLARGKRTEIDSLNGYVVRRAKELGIAAPANFTLFALVRLLEDKAAEQQRAASQNSSA